jgi:hypothetical protein
MVRTFSTFTLKIFSTAWRISTLLALRSTSKHQLVAQFLGHGALFGDEGPS